MKTLKIKPDETFELIIINDNGDEILKECYYFCSSTEIKYKKDYHEITRMSLIPTIDMRKSAIHYSENETNKTAL